MEIFIFLLRVFLYNCSALEALIHREQFAKHSCRTETFMNLDEAQRAKVSQWITEGLKLSDIQNRLASEFNLRLTYMDVRFLVDDLKLTPRDVERPKTTTLGASAAAPIAKDVMTCLFEPAKAWDGLVAMEKTWGGTPAERMAAKYRTFAAQYGVTAPQVGSDEAVQAAMTRSEGSEIPAQTNGVVTGAERGEASAAASGAPQPSPSTGAPQ